MKTLFQSTVAEFFRQRSGMFFVVIAVLFGFLSGREHYAFAVFFLTDQFGILYLLAIWVAYTLFCGHFLINLWRQPEYHFIYHTRLWGRVERLIKFSWIGAGFLQPLLFYGIYIFCIAYQNGLLVSYWPVPVYFILLCLLLSAFASWRVHHPDLIVAHQKKINLVKFPRPVNWLWWSVEWLFREKGVTVLLCKAGAAVVFVCTLLYYGTDDYDLRLPAIGLSLGYLLNIGLSWEIFQWENVIWMWGRSLPLSTSRRWLRVIAVHALIILPETLICLRYDVITFVEMVQLYALGLSLLLLFHTRLYKKSGLLEDAMQPAFAGFVILTLLIMYKIPVLIIALTAMLYAGYTFFRSYSGQTNLSRS
ncbi:MAG TPA: hypothetical protein VGN64_06105 [Dyadobacter sp.]|jgi:hypothetical protein|nr:hypothetical protein [Dyadobacter sp.]